MAKYILKRIIYLIPILLVVSFLAFMILHLIPGDPVKNMLGLKATPESIKAVTERLGLDQPLHVQYTTFVKNALKGDFGNSIRTKKPVVDEIIRRFPITMKLALGGIIVAALLGIVVGVISAVKQNKFWDNFLMVISLLSVSTPSFFLALLLMLVFSSYFKWFPSSGLLTWQSYILPILALGTQSVGIIARTTRSAMLEVLNQDYIRTSKAKGVSPSKIIYIHALKNALIPVITVIGLRFGGLLAGSALIETVFAIPGVGRFMIDGVINRDYPVVQATVLLISSTFVVVNLIVDIIYKIVDPRIKYD